MTPQMKLNRQNLQDLQCIRDIGPENLQRIIDAVRKSTVAPIHPQELQKLMEDAPGGDPVTAGVLLRQLLSLHGMRRQLDLDSGDIISGITAGIRCDSGWDESQIGQWGKVSAIFQELFDLPIVHLTAKALDLSYQHSHLLQSAHVITDIRPLFSKDADEIQGMTISHKLRLRYDDVEGEHGLSVALDERDLKALIRQCERALKKSKTTKTQLKDKANLETLIPGAD